MNKSLISLLVGLIAIAAGIISWLFFSLRSDEQEIDTLRGEVSSLKDTVASYESYSAVNGAAAASESSGAVTGALCFSQSPLPRGEVVAKRIDSGDTYTQELSTEQLQDARYTFQLTEGEYLLRYQAHENNTSQFTSSYYTACGQQKGVNCSDSSHTPLKVKVTNGEIIGDIHLCDFTYNKEPKF